MTNKSSVQSLAAAVAASVLLSVPGPQCYAQLSRINLGGSGEGRKVSVQRGPTSRGVGSVDPLDLSLSGNSLQIQEAAPVELGLQNGVERAPVGGEIVPAAVLGSETVKTVKIVGVAGQENVLPGSAYERARVTVQDIHKKGENPEAALKRLFFGQERPSGEDIVSGTAGQPKTGNMRPLSAPPAESGSENAGGREQAAPPASAGGGSDSAVSGQNPSAPIGFMPRAIIAAGGMLARLGGLGSAAAGIAAGSAANLVLGVHGAALPIAGALLFGSSAVGAKDSPIKAVDGGSHLITGILAVIELAGSYWLARSFLGSASGALMSVAFGIFAPIVVATAVFMGWQGAKAAKYVRAQTNGKPAGEGGTGAASTKALAVAAFAAGSLALLAAPWMVGTGLAATGGFALAANEGFKVLLVVASALAGFFLGVRTQNDWFARGLAFAALGVIAALLALAWMSPASAAAAAGLAGMAAVGVVASWEGPWPKFGGYVREASYDEIAKIRAAYERARQEVSVKGGSTAIIDSLEHTVGYGYATDTSPSAAYHGLVYNWDRNIIAMTADTLSNGSWAFIQAVKTANQAMLAYRDLPDSAEKLAIRAAYMAMAFAEITNSSSRGWSTPLDHKHHGVEPLVKGIYSVLLGVLSETFILSDFFKWVVSEESKALFGEGSPYRYSLYERASGTYYRPWDASKHDRPIPDAVRIRIDEATYNQAVKDFYGNDEKGDNRSTQNFLGAVQYWLSNWESRPH